MLILALDTTTAAGSVALLNDRRPQRVLEVAAIDPEPPVATRLPGDLVTLLERHHIALGDIDVFAVASGPGSFTGLRIGIATMQGLALAERKPLIGVSAFEALASFVAASHIATWIDAWRGEVYAATYATLPATADAGAPRLIEEPVVATPENLLRGAVATTRFIGDGAVRNRDLIGSDRVIEPTPLLAGAIAGLAWDRAQAGELPPPHAIRPLYVRRPDAELARDRRLVNERPTA